MRLIQYSPSLFIILYLFTLIEAKTRLECPGGFTQIYHSEFVELTELFGSDRFWSDDRVEETSVGNRAYLGDWLLGEVASLVVPFDREINPNIPVEAVGTKHNNVYFGGSLFITGSWDGLRSSAVELEPWDDVWYLDIDDTKPSQKYPNKPILAHSFSVWTSDMQCFPSFYPCGSSAEVGRAGASEKNTLKTECTDPNSNCNPKEDNSAVFEIGITIPHVSESNVTVKIWTPDENGNDGEVWGLESAIVCVDFDINDERPWSLLDQPYFIVILVTGFVVFVVGVAVVLVNGLGVYSESEDKDFFGAKVYRGLGGDVAKAGEGGGATPASSVRLRKNSKLIAKSAAAAQGSKTSHSTAGDRKGSGSKRKVSGNMRRRSSGGSGRKASAGSSGRKAPSGSSGRKGSSGSKRKKGSPKRGGKSRSPEKGVKERAKKGMTVSGLSNASSIITRLPTSNVNSHPLISRDDGEEVDESTSYISGVSL